MKKLIVIMLGLCFFSFSSCVRDKVQPTNELVIPCTINDTVLYTTEVASILNNNCLPCHSYPGAGGINLDNFLDSKTIAQSGMLIHSVIHDTNYVIMPPPPNKLLDSCQIKTLQRWIDLGCQ